MRSFPSLPFPRLQQPGCFPNPEGSVIRVESLPVPQSSCNQELPLPAQSPQRGPGAFPSTHCTSSSCRGEVPERANNENSFNTGRPPPGVGRRVFHFVLRRKCCPLSTKKQHGKGTQVSCFKLWMARQGHKDSRKGNLHTPCVLNVNAMMLSSRRSAT